MEFARVFVQLPIPVRDFARSEIVGLENISLRPIHSPHSAFARFIHQPLPGFADS